MKFNINETVGGKKAILEVTQDCKGINYEQNAKNIHNFLTEQISYGTYNELVRLILLEQTAEKYG